MPVRAILFVAPGRSVASIFPKLKESGIEAALADSLGSALLGVKKWRPSLIFARPVMPGFDARSLLKEAPRQKSLGYRFPPVIICADKGTVEEAQEFLDLGAQDYWMEPLTWEKVMAALPVTTPAAQSAAYSKGESRRVASPAPPPASPHPQAPAPAPASSAVGGSGRAFQILGEHPVIRRVLALAKQVAVSKATVLISGESGTGKEMFARYLVAHSDRASAPFVAINCAALPEHLLESELFGHEKGAFTGAIARKPGKFEMAHGGTILLDEISEMDPGLQAKLLRVLQEGEFDRVGGVETVRVDVRVIATTNRRLEDTVAEGKFRQDLYYRLNVIPLKLPALRERGEDVLTLAQAFATKFAATYGLPPPRFSDAAKTRLMGHDWPGNVRELHNLMERATLLAGKGPIEPMHFLWDGEEWTGPAPENEVAFEEALPAAHAMGEASAEPAVQADAEDEAVSGAVPEGGYAALAAASPPGEVIPLGEMEKRMILHSLDKTEGNRTQAAMLLGISVRTLRNKLNEYREQGLLIP